MELESQYDLIVVGSGGASITAALVAKTLGKRAAILEKQPLMGGSTSYSGGVLWVPNNPFLADAGIADSFEKSREYLDHLVTYRGPAVTTARMNAFLRAGPRMVAFLRQF